MSEVQAPVQSSAGRYRTAHAASRTQSRTGGHGSTWARQRQDRDLVIDQMKVPRFRLPARRAPNPRRAILCPIHPCLLFFFASCTTTAEMIMTCASSPVTGCSRRARVLSRPSAVAWHGMAWRRGTPLRAAESALGRDRLCERCGACGPPLRA